MSNIGALVRDANGDIIPQQYYDMDSRTYEVVANGDITDVDFSRKSLLRDANLQVIPSQYYDVDKGEFVVGVLPSGSDGSGGGGTVSWSEIQNKPQVFPPSAHNHDERYNTKEQVQDIIDYIRNQMAQQQGLIAVHAEDEPGYLESKVDNETLVIQNNEVRAKTLVGLDITTAKMNDLLQGAEENIQLQITELKDIISTMASGLKWLATVETYDEMLQITNMEDSDFVIILSDRTKENARTWYLYDEKMGNWRYLGDLTLSNKFTALTDTPNTFENGKFLKSGINGLYYALPNWSDIENRPDVTKAQIENAVEKAHEHPNVSNLDKISENGGILTYNGVKYVRESDLESYINESDLTNYVPKSTLNDYIKKTDINIYIPKKKFLLATNNSATLTVSKGNFIKFPNKRGTIPYDSNTGLFELEIGKDYEIQVMLLVELNEFIKFYISKADKSLNYLPKATLYSHQITRNRGASGSFHTIFTATQTTGNSFGIIIGNDTSTQDSSVKLIYEECALIIKEL